MHAMGVGHHRRHRQDPAMAPLLQLLARRGWGHMRMVGLEKKPKSEQKRKEKKEKGLTGLNPPKQ